MDAWVQLITRSCNDEERLIYLLSRHFPAVIDVFLPLYLFGVYVEDYMTSSLKKL